MQTWQQSIRSSLKSAKSCNDFFQTNQFHERSFPFKIPLEFANLIDKKNPNDPLLLQVLGTTHKQNLAFDYAPIKDEQHSPVSGLIHQYPNRVLLITSRVCAVHCQYCFRQNFNYQQHDAINNWAAIESYLRTQTRVNEVILSGGDPLSVTDEKLQKLITDIERIAHIDTLRIHTRSAVVIPSRITNQLRVILSRTRLNVVLVFHSNHVNELSIEFANKVKQLNHITLLNQSVLLKGVNDSYLALSALSKRLFDLGILPYYLHLLDKVIGSEGFLVSDERAKRIHQQMQKNLSGYLVPKLVRDENEQAKTWIG